MCACVYVDVGVAMCGRLVGRACMEYFHLVTVAKDDINGKSLIRSMDEVTKNICFVLIG